jgi:hypothetical protein
MVANRSFDWDGLTAAAAIITAVGGWLTPYAAESSLGQGFVVWLAVVLAAGVTMGRPDHSLPVDELRLTAIGLGGLYVAAILFHYFVSWLLPDILNNRGGFVVSEDDSIGLVSFFDSNIKAILLLFALMSATALFIGLAAIASVPILESAKAVWKFGASGLKQLKAWIVALAGLVGALAAFWDKVFG